MVWILSGMIILLLAVCVGQHFHGQRMLGLLVQWKQSYDDMANVAQMWKERHDMAENRARRFHDLYFGQDGEGEEWKRDL